MHIIVHFLNWVVDSHLVKFHKTVRKFSPPFILYDVIIKFCKLLLTVCNHNKNILTI